MTSEENLICSFCSKSRKDVTKMIVGSSKVSICNECIGLCNEILEEDTVKAKKEKVKSGELLNPVKIKEFFPSKTVIHLGIVSGYDKRFLIYFKQGILSYHL